jgi:hypothetical protein
MERCFFNLKMEHVWQCDYANHQKVIRDVTDYIVNFYNNQRLYSTMGGAICRDCERIPSHHGIIPP